MNAGERLALLSGLSTRSAGAHLSFLASGATAGAKMVARSGIGSGTALQHLLAGEAVNITLLPSLFVNSNVFYGHGIEYGSVTLHPSLFVNTSTFYDVSLLGIGNANSYSRLRIAYVPNEQLAYSNATPVTRTSYVPVEQLEQFKTTTQSRIVYVGVEQYSPLKPISNSRTITVPLDAAHRPASISTSRTVVVSAAPQLQLKQSVATRTVHVPADNLVTV